MTESTPARTTPDNPAHGCMIDGQPAMPILISEYNALVARVARADARLDRIQTLADEHPAGIDTALIHEALGEPGPAATQATEGICSDPAPETEPNNRWLLAGSRDLSIPQQLPQFTAVHVTPEMERAATERARQMAEAHQQAEKSLVLTFGGQANDHPSRRAGLHDALVGVLGQIPVIPPVAHRRAQADNVLALLYREWPWLRAEAEDADTPAWTPPPPGSTRERLPAALLALINLPDYVSTACQTAIHLEAGPAPTPTSGGAIPDVGRYVDRLHARCRLNHKFTGQLCICRCHTEETP